VIPGLGREEPLISLPVQCDPCPFPGRQGACAATRRRVGGVTATVQRARLSSRASHTIGVRVALIEPRDQ
jgi:hypothetical protein